MNLKQHVPDFVEGLVPQDVSFENKRELFEIPFVKQWTETPGFYRLSISDYYCSKTTHLLMAEFLNGQE